VAERYAAALADVALERKSGEAVRKDLGAFVETFLVSADLRNALESPARGRRGEEQSDRRGRLQDGPKRCSSQFRLLDCGSTAARICFNEICKCSARS